MPEIILVTGGAGFIGSHLCGFLLNKNNKVLCIDNLTTGSKHNIASYLSNPNFAFLHTDISSDEFLPLMKRKNITQIYHLASPASVNYVTQHPVEAAIANSIGTKNLLEIARSKKSRLIFTSSSETYGDPQEHPQKETYWGNSNPVGLRSGYDEGKRFGEALCMAYHREFGVSVGIARIFNTYGPNFSEKDGRVIPQFIQQALKNKNITVHGDGTQTRSFCYVDDTVSGLIKLMTKKAHGPFNIGNPDEHTIMEVAEIIVKLTGSSSKIQFTKRPIDDPTLRKPDIALAKKTLQWKPRVSFRDGLTRTVAYFQKISTLPNHE